MTDRYTGRARITNKQTGASREGEVTRDGDDDFRFREYGVSHGSYFLHAEFTIEPILPEIPSEPGDTFTAKVTRNGGTKQVVLMAQHDHWASSDRVNGFDLHNSDHIDRATIESVITAKERGL